ASRRPHTLSLHDALPIWKFIEENKKLSDPRGKDAPSATQWQWVRDRATVCRGEADLTRLWKDLTQRANQLAGKAQWGGLLAPLRSEEHTSELQSPDHLVC